MKRELVSTWVVTWGSIGKRRGGAEAEMGSFSGFFVREARCPVKTVRFSRHYGFVARVL